MAFPNRSFHCWDLDEAEIGKCVGEKQFLTFSAGLELLRSVITAAERLRRKATVQEANLWLRHNAGQYRRYRTSRVHRKRPFAHNSAKKMNVIKILPGKHVSYRHSGMCIKRTVNRHAGNESGSNYAPTFRICVWGDRCIFFVFISFPTRTHTHTHTNARVFVI